MSNYIQIGNNNLKFSLKPQLHLYQSNTWKELFFSKAHVVS